MDTKPAKQYSTKELLALKIKIIASFDKIVSIYEEIGKDINTMTRHEYLNGLSEFEMMTIFDRGHLNSKETVEKNINQFFWEHFIKSSHIRNFLSDLEINKLRKKIEEDCPEFDAENVGPIINNLGSFFEENALNTIKMVYNELIGCKYYGSGHQSKTDNLRKVERQFRTWGGGIRYNQYYGNGFSYDYQHRHGYSFEDLLKVCKILSGDNPFSYEETFYQLCYNQFQKSDTIVTDYFEIKCYKNGNRKVTFTNLEVLDLLNKIGPSQSKALPDHLKKRYKPEHFQ